MSKARQIRALVPAWRCCGRVIASYFLIYSLPFPLLYIPIVRNSVWEAKRALWGRVVPWVGTAFGLDATPRNNGSGDTVFHHVQAACFLALAVLVAVLSLRLVRADRDATISRVVRGYVRYSLAAIMITYGLMKVFKLQFWDPTFERLLPTVADMSPMGLMWRFMGASWVYGILAGGAEIVGGLLLLARTTRLIAGILLFAVMGNVVALNLCYDVDAKLYSLHLLAMIVWLTWPDMSRLRNLLVPVATQGSGYRWQTSRLGRVLQVAGMVIAAAFVARSALDANESRKTRLESASASPLYGLWDVVEFAVDGSLVNNEQVAPWRRLASDRPQVATVQFADGSMQRYNLGTDLRTGHLRISSDDSADQETALESGQQFTDQLTLAGTIGGHRVTVGLRRRARASIPLLSRGFHWISDQAYNR